MLGGGDGAGSDGPYAAQRHAQVLGFDDDAHALGCQVRCQPVGDLFRQPFQDLRGAGEQSGDAVVGQVDAGDRRLNRALTSIVLTRMRTDSDTREYIHRRLAEGKPTREVRRCLKRNTTRQIFRTLTGRPPKTENSPVSGLTRHRSILGWMEMDHSSCE